MARVLGWATAAACSLGSTFWAGIAAAQGASFPADDKLPPAAAPAPATAPTAAPPAAPATPPPPPPSAAELPPTDSPSVQPPVEDVSGDKGPYVSVTFSPLHLISPIFELQIEGRVVPHLGVAVIGGIGKISSGTTVAEAGKQDFSVYELGTQLIGYPLQPFESLQVGAELMWLHVDTESFNGQPVNANAGGVALGPLIGYKLLTKVGFTFFVQGGFQYVAVMAKASNDAGESATATQSAFIPLLNLNLGWSF